MLMYSWKFTGLMLVIDTERFSCSSNHAVSRVHISFIPQGGEKDDLFMYPNILIQCINIIACAWVAANSLEETLQAFRRTQQGLCCTGDGGSQCIEGPTKGWGLGEAEWTLRQNRFIRSKIKCFLGPDQVFSKCNSIIASPGKEGV